MARAMRKAVEAGYEASPRRPHPAPAATRGLVARWRALAGARAVAVSASSSAAPSTSWPTRWRGALAGHRVRGLSARPDVRYEDPVAVRAACGRRRARAPRAALRARVPRPARRGTAPPLSRDGSTSASRGARPAPTAATSARCCRRATASSACTGCTTSSSSDGLVRRARGFFDLYDAATQLGLLPARGRLGETVAADAARLRPQAQRRGRYLTMTGPVMPG